MTQLNQERANYLHNLRAKGWERRKRRFSIFLSSVKGTFTIEADFASAGVGQVRGDPKLEKMESQVHWTEQANS